MATMDLPTEPDDDARSPYTPPESEPKNEAVTQEADAESLGSDEQRQLHTGLGVMIGMILAGATWTIFALATPKSVSDWTAYEWGEKSIGWLVALWLPGGFVYVPLARKLSGPGSEGLRAGLIFGSFLCPFLWLAALSLFA
jgi:hypothetical protein